MRRTSFVVCRVIHVTRHEILPLVIVIIIIIIIIIIDSRIVSRGWAKASSCLLYVSQPCDVLCQITPLPYLSRSSLHRLAGLPCHIFVSYGLQLVTREVGQSVVLEAVDLWPLPRCTSLSHIADYVYAFCPGSLYRLFTQSRLSRLPCLA